MAKPTSAMNRVRIARVDPELQSVTVLDSLRTTPGRVLFPGDAQREHQTVLTPSHAKLCKYRTLHQFTEAGNEVFPG